MGGPNESGDMWVDWCMTNEPVIMNTWFQHHKRHLYTWKSGDGVNNRIDYNTINKSFRNSSLQVNVYPGADGISEHVPFVTTVRWKQRKLKQKKAGDKLEAQLLKTGDRYREQYQRIANQLNDLEARDQLEDRSDNSTRDHTKCMTKNIIATMEAIMKAKPNKDIYNQQNEVIKRETKQGNQT